MRLQLQGIVCALPGMYSRYGKPSIRQHLFPQECLRVQLGIQRRVISLCLEWSVLILKYLFDHFAQLVQRTGHQSHKLLSSLNNMTECFVFFGYF